MKKQSKAKCPSLFPVIILGFSFFLLYVLMPYYPIHNAPSSLFAKAPQAGGNEVKNITLDFDNVDIRLVIKFMSDLLNKNFLIDDAVKGTVTIISPNAIPVDEAYKVFESILEVKGYAAIPAGSVIKIVPSVDAASRNIEMRTGHYLDKATQEDTLVTQLIPLEHANVETIKNVISPLISKESKLITYAPTNTIILTETASNIERLLKIIKEIDIPSEGSAIQVLTLKHASPDSIAKAVMSALGDDQTATVTSKNRTLRRATVQVQPLKTKIIPDERTGSLIIVATEYKMEEILDLIDKLDIPAPRGKDNIRVRTLKNSNAEDMAKVLGNIASQQKTQAKAGGSESAPLIQDSMVTADKATNSLIITSSPQDYEIISRIIDELDVMRPQVLVEALIAEVSFDKELNLGVEWRTLDAPKEGGYRGFAATNFGQTASIIYGNIPKGMLVGVTKGDEAINIGGIPYPNIGALIQAYQHDSDINILSTPHILATDNEEAKIVIGEDVPYSQREITETSTNYSYIYKEVGISLQLVPHINPDGYVKLEITLKIDKVVPNTGTEAPWTTKREAQTTVMVKDKQTVVIGGLLKDDQFEALGRVPCLGEIPVLGWAFRNMARTNEKTNLQVFLTPHIIKTPEDLQSLTLDKGSSLDMEKFRQGFAIDGAKETSGRRKGNGKEEVNKKGE
ncbi:type II secretion system secretin GspD [bacterium]|nr:type II secretion system secretin GspD [bacterium]